MSDQPQNTIHIRLTPANSRKVLLAMGPLGRSASEVVNTILDAVEDVSIRQIVSVQFRSIDGTESPQTATHGEILTTHPG